MQTTTSSSDREALERAYIRAQRLGVHIAGRGRRRVDGVPLFAVTSASQPGRWHVVLALPARLVCDCVARGPCTHRAVVHAELMRLWRAERDRVEAVEEAKLRAALHGLHATLEERAARLSTAAAPVLAPVLAPVAPRAPDVAYAHQRPAADVTVWAYQDTRPVSIWK